MIPSGAYADRIDNGASHSIAVRGNGIVYSWGANADGQLGDGSTLDSLNPLNVVDRRYHSISGAIAVEADGSNNIVLLDDHTMLGWGPNEQFQLGSGVLYSSRYLGDTGSAAPQSSNQVTADSATVTVQTAIRFPSVIVDPDGKPISNVTRVAMGPNFSAALKQDGTVVVWGMLDAFKDREQDREPVNRFSDKYFDPDAEFMQGRYLNGDPVNDYELMVMRGADGKPIGNIVDIAVGDAHLLALTGNGTVLAWGENDAGQLADGTLRQRAYPVHVLNERGQPLGGITQLAARGETSIAVRADGLVFGWGAAGVLQPEDNQAPVAGLTRPEEPFARIMADDSGKRIDRIRHIVLGSSHALAITFDNTVIGWGDNSSGQLGIGTNNTVEGTSEVVNAAGVPIRDIVEIAVGDSHSLALRRDGQLFAWGSAENGRLGDGTNIDSYYAVEVRRQDNLPFSLF